MTELGKLLKEIEHRSQVMGGFTGMLTSEYVRDVTRLIAIVKRQGEALEKYALKEGTIMEALRLQGWLRGDGGVTARNALEEVEKIAKGET